MIVRSAFLFVSMSVCEFELFKFGVFCLLLTETVLYVEMWSENFGDSYQSTHRIKSNTKMCDSKLAVGYVNTLQQQHQQIKIVREHFSCAFFVCVPCAITIILLLMNVFAMWRVRVYAFRLQWWRLLLLLLLSQC